MSLNKSTVIFRSDCSVLDNGGKPLTTIQQDPSFIIGGLGVKRYVFPQSPNYYKRIMIAMPHLPRTVADNVVTVICVVLFIAWLIYNTVRNYKEKKH